MVYLALRKEKVLLEEKKTLYKYKGVDLKFNSVC